MSGDNFTFFSQFIEKELGIVYSDFNKYQLENRLEEVVKILGLRDVGELRMKAQLTPTAAIKQLLLDIATNNETSFFRDPKLFQVFSDTILPQFAGRKLRVWSAACSSGQEPYTLGLLHLEKLLVTSFEIVATDISSTILKRAEDGCYTQLEVERGLSAKRIQTFFSKEASGLYRVQPNLRSLIKFQPLNLLGPMSQLGTFDIIFCRNVLIYQNVANKSRVVEKLAERLNPGGLLVLGAGESLLGLSDAFGTVKTDGVVYYQLNTPRTAVA